MFKEFSLAGKTALVTGGGRGIGKAIALVLAEAGAEVAVVARTAPEIEEAAREIRGLGRRSLALQCDVNDYSQVEEVIAKATQALGHIDILVNNAGIGGGGGSIAPMPGPSHTVIGYAPKSPVKPETWDLVMKTNLASPFYFCQLVGPQMMARRSGKVINVLSNNAIMVYPFTGAYNPSKAGLQMLTKMIALEWAPYNVNVNGIAPGFFPTEMTRKRHEDPETRKQMLSAIPLGRFADLRDLGLLAVYLASSASDWLTGQIIYLDGGESAIHG